MHTGRSLTICWGVCFQGVHASWGVSASGGCLLPQGGGVVCLLPKGWYPNMHLGKPPINRITHTSKNITLATTLLRPVKINISKFHTTEIFHPTSVLLCWIHKGVYLIHDNTKRKPLSHATTCVLYTVYNTMYMWKCFNFKE